MIFCGCLQYSSMKSNDTNINFDRYTSTINGQYYIGYFSNIAGRPAAKNQRPDPPKEVVRPKDDWTVRARDSQDKTKCKPCASRRKDSAADDEENQQSPPRRASTRSTSKEGKDKPQASLPRSTLAKRGKTGPARTSRRSDGEDGDEFGIGRYATEDYKRKKVPRNCFMSRRFIKCSSTTAGQAKEAVNELAKLVVDDFYEHANRGLVVPHRAEFHYNG